MRDHRRKLPELLLRQNQEFAEDDSPGTGGGTNDGFLRLDAEQNAVRCLRILEVARRLRDTRDVRTPLNILEVGIGYGYVATCLCEGLGAQVRLHAVEHPDRRYLKAPAFLAYLERNEIDLAAMDVLREEIPWPEVSFDLIILSEVLEHLPPTKAPPLIKRLAGRLSPSGTILLSSPNLHSFHRRVRFLLGRGRVFDLAVPLEFTPGTYDHIMIYGRAELEAVLAWAGLGLRSFDYLNWEWIYLGRDGLASKMLCWGQRITPRIVPSLGTTWIATAGPHPPAPLADP